MTFQDLCITITQPLAIAASFLVCRNMELPLLPSVLISLPSGVVVGVIGGIGISMVISRLMARRASHPQSKSPGSEDSVNGTTRSKCVNHFLNNFPDK